MARGRKGYDEDEDTDSGISDEDDFDEEARHFTVREPLIIGWS